MRIMWESSKKLVDKIRELWLGQESRCSLGLRECIGRLESNDTLPQQINQMPRELYSYNSVAK
jgi:hypothetical protein